MRTNRNDYNYVIFVDASGDDGIKFDKCSSLCFTTACFTSSVQDIEHNLRVLGSIKEITGRKKEDELKHSRMRRHRAYKTAIKELESLKGIVSIHNSFKQEIYTKLSPVTEAMLDKKALTAFTHTFPIETILKIKELRENKILVCIDRMKQTEMNTIEQILNASKSHNAIIDITFKDSKDAGFELIQIADVFAGIFRCFFEESITNPDDITFFRTCAICRDSYKTSKLKRSCNVPKVFAARKKLFSGVQTVYPLLLSVDKKVLLHGISMFPSEMVKRYNFIDCNKK